MTNPDNYIIMQRRVGRCAIHFDRERGSVACSSVKCDTMALVICAPSAAFGFCPYGEFIKEPSVVEINHSETYLTYVYKLRF